jgi:hypothetical protein
MHNLLRWVSMIFTHRVQTFYSKANLPYKPIYLVFWYSTELIADFAGYWIAHDRPSYRQYFNGIYWWIIYWCSCQGWEINPTISSTFHESSVWRLLDECSESMFCSTAACILRTSPTSDYGTWMMPRTKHIYMVSYYVLQYCLLVICGTSASKSAGLLYEDSDGVI